MELRVLAQKRGMSPVYESDPNNKEISDDDDDDDDDRNHKHRKKEDAIARSQLFESDVTEQLFSRSYKRGNKPFQNGHLYRETGSRSNETSKKYSFNPFEKDISVKFDQKRPGFSQFSQGYTNLNQKVRVNQSFSDQRDPRFNSVDISSQIVQQGSVHHSLFTRGIPTVSNSHGSSWGPFGLVSGIPNGGLNMIHSLGLQGTFRPVINSSLNMGIALHRCRDFEEQGFCLRGDMCPMEHGVNRIVVEDVQSLSQFNFPISLASANVSIAPVGTEPITATSVVTNTLSNSKNSHVADFYDPDQPLWGNKPHTSTGTQSITQPNVDKKDSFLNLGLSGDNEIVSTSETAVGSLNTKSSVWGRITSNRKRTEMRENMNSKTSPKNFMHNSDSSLKMLSGINGRMIRKPSQKATRTLFINGIPQQNNKKESLLSHFKKFGEIMDIYIPVNSERAFVQFSKSEEAEAALMAPDAVMGNRFIKLWWANRDKLQDIEKISGHKVSPYISVANKRKDDHQSILHNDVTAPVSGSDHSKPVVVKGAKPLQKKLESLEVLKEELRKKQEMLDQKRNDFRLKLDILAKQATGLKGEVAPEHVGKKQKLGVLSDSTKAATLSADDTIIPSAQDDVAATSSKSVGPSGPLSSKTTLALTVQESSSLKASPLSLGHVGSPGVNNRFKLDNRPTAFKIVPPLPDGLADVPVLKEHFSQYGDLLKVQLDNIGPTESNPDPKITQISAQIYFTTRHAAEKAFLSGKSWKGHNLQFVWLNSTNSRKDLVTRENTSTSKNKSDSSKITSQKPSTSGDEKCEKTKETVPVDEKSSL